MKDRLAAAAGRNVSRETHKRLEAYELLLREEAKRHNLVSRGTLDALWERHILDSAQLIRFEPEPAASWVDIGSGAGLPGVVIACLVEGRVTLIEPRRLRVEFLHKVADELGIRLEIIPKKAERAEGSFDVITGRAVAALDQFLKLSLHLSTRNSRWVLPKGRNAAREVAEARRSWQGRFHVERSVTDEDSGIVVVTDMRAKRS